MAGQPVKILEVKAEDWEKGLSSDQETFTNGIFKVFSNIYPFFRKGSLFPIEIATELGSGTISTSNAIRQIMPVYTGGLPQFYVWEDNSKVYLTDGASVTDASAAITTVTSTHREAVIWKSKIIRAVNGTAYSNAIPLSSDTVALTGLTTGPHPGCIGADRNLYLGNGNNVAKITDPTTPGSNSTSVAASLETGYTVRQLINDGRYLVWLADDAGTNLSTSQIKNSCIVAYWDMAKSTFDQVFEFKDSYIASAEIVGDVIKIFTPSGIYITNVATRPKLVWTFGSSKSVGADDRPTDSHCSTVYRQNFLLWGSGKTTGNSPVFAYGNEAVGKPDRLFQHFTATSNSITALGTDNNNVLLGMSVSGTSKLYILNSGSGTRETATANVAGISLPRPYKYAYTKVVLRSPIASGSTVTLKLLNSPSTSSTGAKTIKASEAKTNSTDSGAKVLFFDHTSANDGTDVISFDEISDIELTSNVAIKSFTVYGYPTDERNSHV